MCLIGSHQLSADDSSVQPEQDMPISGKDVEGQAIWSWYVQKAVRDPAKAGNLSSMLDV